MSVYYDYLGHMIADTEEELHAFAASIGLRREWYQTKRKGREHYDLTTPTMRKKAERLGAVKIDPRELLRRMPGCKHDNKAYGDTQQRKRPWVCRDCGQQGKIADDRYSDDYYQTLVQHIQAGTLKGEEEEVK